MRSEILRVVAVHEEHLWFVFELRLRQVELGEVEAADEEALLRIVDGVVTVKTAENLTRTGTTWLQKGHGKPWRVAGNEVNSLRYSE